MKNPLVSIVVPIYNVEKYLENCIASIANQSYNNIELILVDDGSTDRSGDIADDYAKKNNRTIVIHKTNGGLSSARNEGIKRAKGEWISFVDSDDYVDKDFIKKLVDIAIKSKSDIATCSFKPFTNDDSMLKKSPTWRKRKMTGQEALVDMLKNKKPAYICLSIFKKDLFSRNKIVFPEGKKYEDIVPRVELLSSADFVAYTNEQLYYYLMRKDSITGEAFSEKRYTDFEDAIAKTTQYVKQKFGDDLGGYLGYFEFYSEITQLNYLAKNRKNKTTKKYWKIIRKKCIRLFKQAQFPSRQTKLINRVLLMLTYSRTLYSTLYKVIKK